MQIDERPQVGDTLVFEHEDGRCDVLRKIVEGDPDHWENVRNSQLSERGMAWEVARSNVASGGRVWYLSVGSKEPPQPY